MRVLPRLLLCLLPLAASATRPAEGDAPRPEDEAPDFQREVRPLLSARCFACHGPDEGQRAAELRLDRREDATRDRGGYAALVPGDRDASELWARVTDPADPMPPAEAGHALEPGEVELLGRWIDAGAPYARHWSFVPPERPGPPAVRDAGWCRSDLDRFVLARLEAEGLAPSPEADRRTLARRLSFDLRGLPPTPEELARFLADDAPTAYEDLVERFLGDEAYGERWAAMWLDLARYADSKGHGSDPLRTIWRYRDWVIDAYNRNLPFDRFTVEQLAGDLLPDPTLDQRLATAFHRNTMVNTEGGTDDEEFRVAAVKDRANTTFQVWMGLTLGCAQCHSHKFDPISQREYYQAYAFFDQTADADGNDDAPLLETPAPGQAEELARLEARLAELRAERAARAGDPARRLEEWRAERARARDAWAVADLRVARGRAGGDLEPLGDGSWLARGPGPEREVHELGFDAPAGVRALRLEVLRHPDLAAGGPGRRPGIGNVVLDHLEARVVPPPGATVHGAVVRVVLPGPGRFLHLAEVQVFEGEQELAHRGRARQSSTDFGGDAARAVDGDPNGAYTAGSVSHTARQDDPWWEVELPRTARVDRIVLHNRTDGGLAARLDGARLEVLDAAGRVVWGTALGLGSAEPRTLRPAVDPLVVPFERVSATFDSAGWEVARLVDDERDAGTGWGLNPGSGDAPCAVLESAFPLPAGRWEVELHQPFGDHHVAGRLRLATSTDSGPLGALPADLAALLSVPASELGEDERARLVARALEEDPDSARLTARIRTLEQARADLDLPRTPVMVALPADRRRTTRVLLKGNFLSPGEPVEAAVPAALHPWPEGLERDRLGLARWLMDDANPLTARVHANRLWARLFGTGLVETEEDFGSQGAYPSHPELLDWLAVELRDGGWDQKAFLRTLVTSATYRQASRVSDELLARDPRNRLLGRGPRVRLEAEMVRDQALALAGLLNRELHGPSVFPPQPDGLWQAAFNGERNWETDTGPDRWRRGLYVFLRRTIPYPSMETFDRTSHEVCTLRRIPTNTPLQALVTLNDPVYVEAAQGLARRLLAHRGAEGDGAPPPSPEADEALLARAYELCTCREADPERVAILRGLLEVERAHYRAHPEAARALADPEGSPLGPAPSDVEPAELAAWTVLASVLLNLDEVLVKG